MQTFLPYASFTKCARVLDARRLGKQRVEALQILRATLFEDYGWQNHPVVRMWRGYTEALVSYAVAITNEWVRRGFSDRCLGSIAEFARGGRPRAQRELAKREIPPWLGWEALHRSHRSALVRKDEAYYRPLFPDVPADLPYVWPEVSEEQPAQEPFTAWVVRAPSRRALAGFLRDGVVALAPRAPDARPTGKDARQLHAFLDEVHVGDALIVPDGDVMHVGEVASAATRSRRGHVRRVRWLGESERRALRRPARLQNPRAFFALRGERDPRGRVAVSR